MDSLTKVRAAIDRELEARAPAGVALLAQQFINLPPTAEQMDAELEAWARLALELRSDDAPQLTVVHA